MVNLEVVFIFFHFNQYFTNLFHITVIKTRNCKIMSLVKMLHICNLYISRSPVGGEIRGVVSFPLIRVQCSHRAAPMGYGNIAQGSHAYYADGPIFDPKADTSKIFRYISVLNPWKCVGTWNHSRLNVSFKLRYKCIYNQRSFVN